MRRGAAVAVAIIAMGTGMVGCQSNGATPAGSTSTTASSGVDLPADTTPAAAVWAVPRAFLGEWTGVVTGAGSFDLVFTIRSGKGGEEVVNAVATEQGSGNRCESIGRMIYGTQNELTFAFRLVDGNDCTDDGRLATLGVHADRSAGYSSERPGGTLTGMLQKA